ncbi:hypothetical protein [Paenibacillus sp. J2TS4]|uniref:hypothetical protein n=1 Tax=Paenibacillus sp. J2TS4 TaxID=2807194 RepID=UPI001BCD7B2F|nr:hypothetical protein [Paenibacillus sp. J2TS4]
MESRMTLMESNMTSMESSMTSMENRMTSLETQMSIVGEQLDRMECSQREDVISMLHLVDKKITTRTDRHEHQINVLNDRLLVVEADVRKLLTKE